MHALDAILRDDLPVAERQAMLRHLVASKGRFTLADCDLRGCAIAGLEFTGMTFERVDLRDTDCRRSSLPFARDCRLDGVNAEDASFGCLFACSCRGMSAPGARLAGLTSGSDLSGSDLREATVGPVSLTRRDQYEPSRFDESNLDDIDATAGYMRGSSFRNASIRRGRLARADLRACDLRGTDLTGANLAGADLRDANFEGAIWKDTIIDEQQWEDLRTRVADDSAGSPRLIRPLGHLAVERLAARIAELMTIRIWWRMVDPASGQIDEVFLSVQSGPREGIHASSFRRIAPDFDPICSEAHQVMYTWTDHRPMQDVMADIAADYTGWTVDPSSIRVADLDLPEEHELLGLTREMLAAVFS
jgi:uncharacterized protein YjbI with pentapeptide repeats